MFKDHDAPKTPARSGNLANRVIANVVGWLGRWSPSLCIFLSIAILGYCALLASVGVTARLTQLWPQNPWEAAAVVDGWRASHNMPVYEVKETGHATLMYGPSQPFLLGLVFKVLPASKTVPQVISFLCAIGLVALVVLALMPFCSRICSVLVALSAFAIENRIGNFAEGRPDLIAWILGFSGLVMLYMYFAGRALKCYVAGLALMVFAVTFKQTAAMLALVPPLALALEGQRSRPFKDYLWSVGPLAGVALLLAAITVLAKNVHHYMIVVPGSWPIHWEALPKTLWTTLAAAPCLWYAVSYAVAQVEVPEPEARRRQMWWCALFAVTFPLATLSFVKLGGAPNSLLPTWIAIIGLSWHLLAAGGAARVELATVSVRGGLHILALSFCIALTLTPNIALINRSIGYFTSTWKGKNEKYLEVVESVRQLQGVVYAPEDPTIVLRAKGIPTRSIYAEYDAMLVTGTMWPLRLPDYLSQEFSRADYIIDVVGFALDVFGPRDAAGMGFVQIWSNGDYVLWGKPASAR